MPQLRTPLVAFTSQLPAERFATVSDVDVAFPKMAPVDENEVVVAFDVLRLVAKKLVEVALVEVEIPTVSPPLMVEEPVARRPAPNDWNAVKTLDV